MITLQGINHYFGKFHALHDVSFTVPSGCIAGFIGPNGAGKSTTLRSIAGILVPQEGQINLDGVSLLDHPIEARRKIGYMQETPTLYREMKIREYLEFVARIKGIAKDQVKRAVSDVMERCSVAYIQNRLVGNISKGNRQRVTLAQALLGDPKILLLDEPTSAMDPAEVIRIRQFIRSLGGSMTVLLSSHILSEVSQICDYLIFIREGRIHYKGSIQDVGSVVDLTIQRVALRFSNDVSVYLENLRGLPGGQVVGAEGMFVQVDITSENTFYPALYQAVSQYQWPLREISAREHRLESLFRDTGGRS